jgi:outer membrane lipase/esterase
MHKALIGIAAIVLPLGACGAPAAPAAEQSPAKVERIVAFGDSFADDGNIFELAGTKPPRLYPKGRFSDGVNFVDAMGEALGVPVANFALGGAVTGAGSATFRPAGFDPQIDAFLAGGGGPAFPRLGGRFAANDLVVVSIGGNDARRYEKSFGAPPAPGRAAAAIAAAPQAAERSVAQAKAGLDRLVGAGARRILFLGGDVGRLPEVRGTAVAPIGSAFSAHYNQGMRQVLAGYAARGIDARFVDLDTVARAVEADPAAHGLSGAGACPQACAGNPSLARRYLFHLDRLHPSEAGHRLIARHALAVLAAPLDCAP